MNDVIATHNGAVRYELAFHCFVKPFESQMAGSACDPTCCASICTANGNCNSFHIQYNTRWVPRCHINVQGIFQYSGDWNCRPATVFAYTRCEVSCPEGQESGQESLLSEPCTACTAGSYKSMIGPGRCTPCAESDFTNSTGAIHVDSCNKCDLGTHTRITRDGCDTCVKTYDARVLTDASERQTPLPDCIEFLELSVTV